MADAPIGPDDLDALLWRMRVQQLLDDCATCIDEDRLESWPDFFTEHGRYEVKPRENEAAGLPIAAMLCDNRAMMHDRVVALRRANVFQAHTYRHFSSALQIESMDNEMIRCSSNYLVVQTLQDGVTRIYQAGRFHDVVERGARLLFRSRLVLYDTLRVQTLLVRPI